MAVQLWALFTSAFLSATLLPGGSEALLAWQVHQGVADPALLWAVATAGNTLGAMTSWGVGWLIALRYPARGLLAPARQRAVERVRQWGAPTLLLAWMPVLGDPLCVAAGWLRMSFFASLLFIALGKALRYALILWVFV